MNAKTRKPTEIPPENRQILTVAEAVAMTTLSDITLRRAIRKKLLKVKRVGRKILIRREDLDLFLRPE